MRSRIILILMNIKWQRLTPRYKSLKMSMIGKGKFDKLLESFLNENNTPRHIIFTEEKKIILDGRKVNGIFINLITLFW